MSFLYVGKNCHDFEEEDFVDDEGDEDVTDEGDEENGDDLMVEELDSRDFLIIETIAPRRSSGVSI